MPKISQKSNWAKLNNKINKKAPTVMVDAYDKSSYRMLVKLSSI